MNPYHQKWYDANKDHARALQAAWYAANKDSVKARSAARYAANKDRIAAQSRAYRAANAERLAAKQKARRLANLERALLRDAKRRAAAKGIEFDLSILDVQIPDRCPVLGVKLTPGGGNQDYSPSIDRIDCARGYVKNNIIVVSSRANRLKSDASLAEMQALAAFYSKVAMCA